MGLDVVLISLADPSQEVDGARVAHVPLESLEDVLLRLESLVLAVRLNERVGEDPTHCPCEFLLAIHVHGIRRCRLLRQCE